MVCRSEQDIMCIEICVIDVRIMKPADAVSNRMPDRRIQLAVLQQRGQGDTVHNPAHNNVR